MDRDDTRKKKRRKKRKLSRASEGALDADTKKDTQRSSETQISEPPAATYQNRRKWSSSNKRSRKCSRQNENWTEERQTSASKKAPNHQFDVDAADHCETPLEAYRDIVSLLDQIARSLGKTRSSLSIYDPYYCDGGVKVKLNSLGFRDVCNENEDFYKSIKNGTVPEYDVLVTNPPYSGVHVERLLTFVANGRKPFLLLLPHYVYTKDYYQCALGSTVKPFFLVPKSRYAYLPPAWVTNGSTALAKGKVTTSPFPSFWYCRANNVSPGWLTQTYGTSGVYRHDRKIQYANCTAHIPRDMKGEFDATKKRPNARARKRAAKKRAAMCGAEQIS